MARGRPRPSSACRQTLEGRESERSSRGAEQREVSASEVGQRTSEETEASEERDQQHSRESWRRGRAASASPMRILARRSEAGGMLARLAVPGSLRCLGGVWVRPRPDRSGVCCCRRAWKCEAAQPKRRTMPRLKRFHRANQKGAGDERKNLGKCCRYTFSQLS